MDWYETAEVEFGSIQLQRKVDVKFLFFKLPFYDYLNCIKSVDAFIF